MQAKTIRMLTMLTLLWLSLGPSFGVQASTRKTEIVEETENKESKMFCSKSSEADAKKACDAWLIEQKKHLGDRVLTVYCSAAEQASSASGSCLYRSVGEIKYVLRKYRTETVSE